MTPLRSQDVPEPATILVYVGLDLLGDGLVKLPFVRALRSAFPRAHVTWLAGRGETVYAHVLQPLVRGLIDEVIENAGVGRKWGELLRRPLAGRAFDLVIDTQYAFRTALILRRIRSRTFISPAFGFHLSDRRPPGAYVRPPHLARRLHDLVELAKGEPVAATAQPAFDEAAQAAAAGLLPEGPVYVGFAPGAGHRSKCWPLANFIAAARVEAERGRHPVFLLGPQEADWIPELRTALPGGRFPLQDAQAAGIDPGPLLTIALGRRLAAAVANDSGGGHLLAVSGVPLVSLWGPSHMAKFLPSAPILKVISAQQFGGMAMDLIPVAVVSGAIDTLVTPDRTVRTPG